MAQFMQYRKYFSKHVSPQTAKLALKITNMIEINADPKELLPFYEELVKISKRKNEIPIYFRALYDILCEIQGNAKTFMYCKMFLQDYDKLFDSAVLQAPENKNFLKVCACMGLEEIEHTYMLHAINKKAIDKVFKRHREAMNKYSDAHVVSPQHGYFYSLMFYNILANKKIEVKKALSEYEKIEKEQTYCYVCSFRQKMFALVYLGEAQVVEQKIEDILAGNIPLWSKTEYEKCQLENPLSLYDIFVSYIVECGRFDDFEKYADKYYSYYKIGFDNKQYYSSPFVAMVYLKDFTMNKNLIEVVQKFCEKEYTLNLYEKMFCYLAYSVCLRCEEVDIPEGIYLEIFDCNLSKDMANKFEQQADEIGERFIATFPDYNYQNIKDFHKKILEHKPKI